MGDWVQVLEGELARVSDADTLSLDLSGVDFADQRALELLRRMTEEGVEFIACSPLLQSLLCGSQA